MQTRRNFLNNCLVAGAGFIVLPSATTYNRIWYKKRLVLPETCLVDGLKISDGDDFNCPIFYRGLIRFKTRNKTIEFFKYHNLLQEYRNRQQEITSAINDGQLIELDLNQPIHKEIKRIYLDTHSIPLKQH